MNKRRCLRRRLLFLGLIGIFIGVVWFWHSSQPYTHTTTFLQIPFGDGEKQISKRAIIDLPVPVRLITVTGFLAFDQKLNICLSDQRIGKGERFLFFDNEGKLKRWWLYEDRTGTYTTCIALNPDGSIWVSGFGNKLPWLCAYVRKYDKSGRVILQFGEPRPEEKWEKPVASDVKQLLTECYHHRWGSAYRFGSGKITGLWVDRKGRVYVLTEYPSLHIFRDNGEPLAVFDIDTSDRINFEGDMGNLGGGTPTFVDWEGCIYTIGTTVEIRHSYVIDLILFFFPSIRRKVYEIQWDWVKVWEYEKGVRDVFSAKVPESGSVVGVDGQKAVYFSSSHGERIYRIDRTGKVRKIFEPKRWYRKFLKGEWEKIFSQDPKHKKEVEQYWHEREKNIERRIGEDPTLKRKLHRYQDVYEYVMMEYRGGPRVGHVAHVDRDGNLYLTLVTATHFRIDKIERASKLERWWMKLKRGLIRKDN